MGFQVTVASGGVRLWEPATYTSGCSNAFPCRAEGRRRTPTCTHLLRVRARGPVSVGVSVCVHAFARAGVGWSSGSGTG